MRRTTAERDRTLDMLGRRQGYPKPIPYASVASSTGILRSTLRSMVRRDRQRRATCADPSTKERNGTQRDDGTGETASTCSVVICPDVRVNGRQAVAVEALAVGCSVVEAAKLAGVDQRTVHRWRREPGFRAALEDGRGDYTELARSCLRSLAARALAALGDKIPTMNARELCRMLEMALDRTGIPKTGRIEQISVSRSPLAHLTDEELDAEIAELEDLDARTREARERMELAREVIELYEGDVEGGPADGEGTAQNVCEAREPSW
jgi:hypothetical protein